MSKFNTPQTRARTQGPIVSEASPSGVTGEGGQGWVRDPKSELFLFAVSNFVAESSFYETAHERDTRFTQLVTAVADTDLGWLTRFVRWLRTTANMRSAALVAALDGAVTALAVGAPGSRQLVDAAMNRADEPGEALAYWTSHYGRAIPKPVKRGIAAAAVRLFTERALLKYDTSSKGFRFADVIDLTHPKPKASWQSDLFHYALDRRHDHVNDSLPETLPMIRAHAKWSALSPEGKREALLAGTDLAAAGVTWESLAGTITGGMDAKAWEAVIGAMGYMALLRNLRNFEAAEVSEPVLAQVVARLTDPEQVASSRQLPMRFLSAHKATKDSLRFGWPLEKALTLSLSSVPALSGRSLVLVDMSGSMYDRLSARSDLQRWEAAAVFGAALAMRADAADLVEFGTDSGQINFGSADSVLAVVGKFTGRGGTYTAQAVQQWFDGHDRVVIVTDEQASMYGDDPTALVPAHVPVYTWNLGGYRYGHGPSNVGNRHTFGGLSDAAFSMIPLLEAGQNAEWPF